MMPVVAMGMVETNWDDFFIEEVWYLLFLWCSLTVS